MTAKKITVRFDATDNPTVEAGQKVCKGQHLTNASGAGDFTACPISGVIDDVRFDPEDHTFVITISAVRRP